MNENDFDRAARAWLDDGPTRMSDRAVLSALEVIHTTRQRRPLWPAWRARPVSIFTRMASAAALVVAAGFLAVIVVTRPHGPAAGATPSPASSSPAGALQTPLTSTFVSPTYGYTFKYGDRGGLTPAKGPWDPVTQPRHGNTDDAYDRFDMVETGFAAVYLGASTVIPDGVSIDAWVDQYVSPLGCWAHPRSQQAEITIDGQPGRIFDSCINEIDATVVAGGRLYLFILAHDRPDARAVFDAWVATIDLRPEDAVVGSSTPS